MLKIMKSISPVSVALAIERFYVEELQS